MVGGIKFGKMHVTKLGAWHATHNYYDYSDGCILIWLYPRAQYIQEFVESGKGLPYACETVNVIRSSSVCREAGFRG